MAAASVARPLIFTLLLISAVEGRILGLGLTSSDDGLISDGIDGAELSAASSCRHEYGFLPCAENAAGYIFMIVVYQVLLIVADKMIGSGSELLFYITGADLGGILFRILRALPSMMLMILSGIFSNKADAQSQVSVVVGVYAGITVFGLTVQWFMCMVSASKPLNKDSDHHKDSLQSKCFPAKEKLRILIDNGVEVDVGTSRTAKIMLLSLIPYLVLQLVYVFPTSSGKRFMTLIALIVSSLSLIVYFVYQIQDPWMQRRSLDYSKFDIVQRKFVEQVEQMGGNLVKEDGTLDESVVRRFFIEADKNKDKCVAYGELERVVRDIFKLNPDIDPNEAMEKVMSKFDNDRDHRITEEEFIEGFKNWIHDATKNSASSSDFNPKEMWNKANKLLREKNENNIPEIDKIMSKILKQAEGQLLKSEALITDDGKPNIDRIQRLFKDYDSNEDGCLTSTELKKLIGKVKFGAYKMEDDDVMKEMFREFDKDQNGEIDENEFIEGVKGYLKKAMESVHKSEITRAVDAFHSNVWKEVKFDRRAFLKSVLQVLLGLAAMTVLAKPLMSSIMQLSNAMNFPSFIVSFVVVPLAMNARAAIAAILPASKTASLTFSEIYGGVIMNNIAGLTTLLAIVYAKELTWDFSAEVITILVVCGIIGLQAFLSTTYRLWTCIPAILLYPISLGLFYFVQEFLNWN